jgi:hypothetical protein
MRVIYDNLTAADFSRQVLSVSTGLLKVLELGDIGWSDLGDPPRVLTLLSQIGLPNEQLAPQAAVASNCA